MDTPYNISSSKIKTDGIYFSIIQNNREDIRTDESENLFYLRALSLSSTGRLFLFRTDFKRKELTIEKSSHLHYIMKSFAIEVMTPLRDFECERYSISHNANNMTANAENEYYYETVACSLFSDNKLHVQIFLKHKDSDRIEEKEDNLYEFISLVDINSENLNALKEFISRFDKKKSRWFF
jgi:hypothetical protein